MTLYEDANGYSYDPNEEIDGGNHTDLLTEYPTFESEDASGADAGDIAALINNYQKVNL